MPSSKSKETTLRVVVQPEGPLASFLVAHLANILKASFKQYDTLAEAVGKSEREPVLLALVNPVEALAGQLFMADTPQKALAAWRSDVAPMLESARRVRRQLMLVDARALLLNDPEVLSLLDVTAALAPADIPPPPDPIALVLADAMLARDPVASRLAAEIETLQRGPSAVQMNEAQLGAAHADLKNAQAVSGEETALLRENIEQQLAVIASGTAECESLRKAVSDYHILKAQTEAMQHRIETGNERAALREAMLSATLLQDQTDLTAVNTRLAKEQGELDRVLGSTSWRLTSPLRAVRSRTMPRNKN